MIYKTFNIALELKQTSTNPPFTVIEGDTGNRLRITVTDGGSPVDLTGCRVIAVFSKTNGMSMQDSGFEDGGIEIGGAYNNEVTISLFPSSIAPGNVECEMQIYSGESMEVLVTTARFNFKANRAMMNEDVLQGTNEYPLLVQLIQTVNGYVDAEAVRVLAEQARATAENQRVVAEQGRVSAETARQEGFAAWQNADATATTLSEGSAATATVAEVGGHKRFTFGIPVGKTGAKGDKGDKGDPGEGAENLRDGSTFGSIRSKYSRVEDDSYKIGGYAVALGYNTAASGDKSHAEGDGTLAEGYRSHAEGCDTVTKIYAPNSHAEGWGTIAGSSEQHVQGRYNIEDENSKYAHVVGNGWESGDVVTRSNAHTLSWTGNAWYQGTIKVGGTSWDDGEEVALKSDLSNLGSGGGASNLLNGSAEGSLRSIKSSSDTSNYTIGENAVALGFSSQASGKSAHAGGFDVTASGHYSHAEGHSTTASGSSSHAEGKGTTASGGSSHAEGSSTTASGGYSHAEGQNTIASSIAQHVQGRYNIEDTQRLLAHIVGNGEDDDNRSNAHTLDWDGNAWYQGRIKVGGTGWNDATDEVALKSDLEGLGGGGSVSDNDILAALIETDSLPAITTTAGAILTDTNGNIIIRY